MPDALPDSFPTPPEDRLRRLEESVGFSEHQAEELTRQLLDLDRRVRQMADRLSRIEGRLVQLAEPTPLPNADTPQTEGPSNLPPPQTPAPRPPT